MKKRVSVGLMALLMMASLMAGCASEPEPVPSPSPMLETTPQADSPTVQTTPAVTETPMTNAGGAITGFVEGAVIELEKLPKEISEAVKKQYAEATVKSAAYATYENKQMYKLTLEMPEGNATEEVYVTADGQVIPAKATAASPAPDASAEPAEGVESGK